MGRALRSIAWLGTVAGVLALIGVGAALVIGIAVYVVGLEALDLTPVGGTLLLVPVGMAVGGAVLWALSKPIGRLLASLIGEGCLGVVVFGRATEFVHKRLVDLLALVGHRGVKHTKRTLSSLTRPGSRSTGIRYFVFVCVNTNYGDEDNRSQRRRL